MRRTDGRRVSPGLVEMVTAGATMLFVWGCASTGTASVEPSPPQVVDSKATLPLSQIEPTVAAPVPPESLRPLSERAGRRLAKAETFVAAQRFTEASIELERAMRYEPNHPQIHAALALLHWKARNIERAKDHAGRAIEANSAAAAPHYVLARCHLERGDRINAITSFRRALLCPDFSTNFEIAALTRYHLAAALSGEGYAAAALEQLDSFEVSVSDVVATMEGSELRSLLQGKRAPLVRMRADLLEQLGRYADAAEALRRLDLDGQADVATSVRLTRLLLRAGDPEGALEAVRQIQSDEPEVIDLLFLIHEKRGKPKDTLDDLRSRMALRPDNTALSMALVDVQLKLGRVDEALAGLRQHVSQHPNDIEAPDRLVGLLLDHDQRSEAMQVCAAAIRRSVERVPDCVARIAMRAGGGDGSFDATIAPDMDYARCYLQARVSAVVGQGDRTLLWLERSHELTPKFLPTRAALAKAYIHLFRYDDALAVARRADEASPEAPQLERLLGTIYERLDDLSRAAVHFRAAIQLDRSNTDSMFALAQVYRRSGKTNLAQRQLRVLLSAKPGHEGARELLAVMYMREGKGKQAFEQIESLKKYSDKPTTIARCETLLDSDLRQDVKALRAHLVEAMERATPDAATWMAIAETYTNFEPEKQREAYAAALKLDPEHDEAAQSLVRAMQFDLDFEAAAAQLRQMLQRRPNRQSWHKELIDVLTTLQEYDSALAHAQSQAQREDVDADARRDYRLRVLHILRLSHRKEDLIARLNTWADAEPDDPQWQRWLADEYVTQDQAALAVGIRKKLYEATPDDWSALGGLVEALAASDRNDRALQYALDRLDVDPESDNAVWMLASLLADADRLEEAIELVRTRLRDTFQRQFFQDFLIGQLQRAERFDELIEYIETLHDEGMTLLADVGAGRRVGRDDGVSRKVLQPNDIRNPQALQLRIQTLRERLALAMIGAKRYAAARQRLNDWLEQVADPTARGAFLRLIAFDYRAEGNETRAAEFMQEALAGAPDDVLLNNDVAYGWIDRGVRLEEAERMSRFALGSRPRQGAYLDTYGWLQYKKGDFAGAVKWLNRSRNSSTGQDPVVHDHLGDAYWRAGKKEDAVEVWTKAAELAKAKEEDAIGNADEKRVRDTVQQKIDAARSGNEPAVAPLALPTDHAEDTDHNKS